MILQLEGEPARSIPVPEHRTEPVLVGDSQYVGVLTNERKRRVIRLFRNATLSHKDEFVAPADIPADVRGVIDERLDHLDEIYFKSKSR